MLSLHLMEQLMMTNLVTRSIQIVQVLVCLERECIQQCHVTINDKHDNHAFIASWSFSFLPFLCIANQKEKVDRLLRYEINVFYQKESIARIDLYLMCICIIQILRIKKVKCIFFGLFKEGAFFSVHFLLLANVYMYHIYIYIYIYK